MANEKTAANSKGPTAKPAKQLVSGRFGRFARLASLGVKAGASALGGGTGAASAEAAREVLGNLRGLAAKMGQMASYVDGVVPEKQREAYELGLRALRSQAPRSPPDEVRRVLSEEFGRPVEELFQTWDDEPVASASIGQVHRATLLDGSAVAVKVQHPGVAAAVESDLSNASILQVLVQAVGGRRVNAKEMLDVAKARFREELDYTLEAERTRAFRAFHAGDPRVRVPAVIDDRSTRRVLTTEWVTGLDFEDACARPESERRRWAETMWRFVFRGNLVFGQFNADLYPGNYFFHDDGVVTFIDFGCVQELPPDVRKEAMALHLAAIDRDERLFGERVSRVLGAREGEMDRITREYSRRCFEPLFTTPYRITREYAAELVTEAKEMGQKARGLADSEYFNIPPHMLFLNRLQFGFYSVLARLDVPVDYAAIERAFITTEG